jgi:4-amino-4-deoxy-L-arabinose transferase-like glycosyltransferase
VPPAPSLDPSAGADAPAPRSAWACLFLVLVVAVAARVPGLGDRGYVLDESWWLEIATGRGSAHERLPVDRLVPAMPHLFSLADAPPWWQVWSHVEVTYPPLYPILLRWWEDAFGGGDLEGRAFAVVASVVSVALLFDVVRLQAGVGAACWAGALMAMAGTQVEHARMVRGYTLLTAAALAAADAMVRIDRLGLTRRRWFCLAVAALATLLTHYFCLGTLLGLAAWAATGRRDLRRPLLAALATAGVVFAAAWGPFMWRQRHLFSTEDPNTQFLVDPAVGAGSRWVTALRVVIVPSMHLFPPPPRPLLAVAVVAGAALYTLPLVPALRRRTPWIWFWWLWLSGTVAAVAALDFARGTVHLYVPRYTLLAGPAAYALIPGLARALRWRRWAIGGAVVVTVACCAAGLPRAYAPDAEDPRALVRGLVVAPGPHDLLVFAGPPAELVAVEDKFLRVARYLPDTATPCAILTRPAPTDVLAAARGSRVVYLFASAPECRAFLPEARVIGIQAFHGLGVVWTLADVR